MRSPPHLWLLLRRRVLRCLLPRGCLLLLGLLLPGLLLLGLLLRGPRRRRGHGAVRFPPQAGARRRNRAALSLALDHAYRAAACRELGLWSIVG